MSNLPKLLTPEQAAEILGVRVQTMAVWRSYGRYPLPFVRAGRLIRYRTEDLIKFIEDRTQNITA